jgi:Fe-S cluster assembly protein SufD
MKKALSTPVAGRYQLLFDELLSERVGQEPEGLLDQRRAAFDRFLQTGMPTRRVENWKYTDVSQLATRNFVHRAPSPIPASRLRDVPLFHEDDATFVFVDGHYQPHLSLGEIVAGLKVTPLVDTAEDPRLKGALSRTNINMESPFVCLNRALWQDGLLLRVSGKQRLDRRIHVIFLHGGDVADALISPRLVVALGGYAEARLAVTHASLRRGMCFNNGCIDVELDEGAQLEMCHTQALSPDSLHLVTTRITQQRDSHLHTLDFHAGSALARHDLNVALAGEGASVTLDGIYVSRDRQVVDSHTVIEHMQPNCTSRQLYKGILDDRSTAIFNGAVRVHPGASGTDGSQMNRNLLLSTMARVNTKPELEIANDDVRCTHGATVGQLDPLERFYLASRGIDPDAARDMLSRGFVEEVLYRLKDTRRHAELHQLLDRYFGALGSV